MEIGSRLKKARIEMGLTQERVAEEIGVSRQSVSNWENNRSYPDIVSVIKLSDLYSVSLDELLKEDKKMIRHLAETAKSAENSRRLLKWILFGAYAALWVLFIPFFWLCGRDFLINSERAVYLFFYPLCTGIITLLIGAGGYFGVLKWLFIPINGIMCILSYGVTWRLEEWLWRLSVAAYQSKTEQPFVLIDFLKDYLSDTEFYYTRLPLAGMIAAAAGLLIGSFIRYYRTANTKQADDKANCRGGDATENDNSSRRADAHV